MVHLSGHRMIRSIIIFMKNAKIVLRNKRFALRFVVLMEFFVEFDRMGIIAV